MIVGVMATLFVLSPTRADESFAKVCEQVNSKVVKIFGAGGIKNLAAYCTGVIISPDGYILTLNSYLVTSENLRVHLADGSRYEYAKLVAADPDLDVAIIKIGDDKHKVEDLPCFNVLEAAQRPRLDVGAGVLAFSNLYEHALREEPVSVQHGVIEAYSQLYGKKGIYDQGFTGKVYVLDAITNNPGAAGGALTNRKGELVGLIGKELTNELSQTWINYAMPIDAKLELMLADGKKTTVSIADMVEKVVVRKEKYNAVAANRSKIKGGGFTGIILVANPVERTPPYVEEVVPNSPAAKAGLKPDDLIVYVDGLPVGSIQTFNETLDRYRPGTEVKLEVRRGDKLTTVPLMLSEMPKPSKK